jgi:hypothetical protein
MVIRTAVFRCLLRLFPAEFRQQFEDDIGEYLTLRHLEVQPLGRWSALRHSAHMAAELVVAAVKLRAAAVTPARTALWLAATIGGLGIGIACLSLVLVIFEVMVRTPLLTLSRHGTDVGVVPHLTGMVAAVGVLVTFYASIRPGPHKRRQSAHRPD